MTIAEGAAFGRLRSRDAHVAECRELRHVRPPEQRTRPCRLSTIALSKRKPPGSRFDVETGEGGAAVLEAIQRRTLDLVLLWHMPNVSGADVCRFLRETYDQVRLPILILRAGDTDDDLLEAIDVGANDLVTKPCKAPELNRA